MLDVTLAGAVILVGVGLYGLLIGRNLIKMFVALQVAAKGAVLALVLAGNAGGQLALGQSLAITVIAADTVAVAVGLALAVQVKRRLGTLDTRELARLRG